MAAAAANRDRQRFVVSAPPVASGGGGAGFAGAQIDNRDPLALFEHDRTVKQSPGRHRRRLGARPDWPRRLRGAACPDPGDGGERCSSRKGDTVHAGQQVAVMEAMKMEHVIKATVSGIVRGVTVAEGDVIVEGHPLVYVEEADVGAGDLLADEAIDPDFIRGDLQEIIDRHAYTLDENRPEAVAKRRKRGYRMPRENIAQLDRRGLAARVLAADRGATSTSATTRRRCARTPPPTASSPAPARSTPTSSGRRPRAPASSPTTTR